MSLDALTRESVLAATREYDELGRDSFLRKYGFGPAREYFLSLSSRRYDSKAIAGAAHRFALPDLGPLPAREFSGGEKTVARTLERLGFTVEHVGKKPRDLPALNLGAIYSWDQLAAAFEFKPSMFQVAGGMLPRPEFDVLLLITHPGGARSFDYEDRWDGTALIYTGRGKTGDQRLDGPNRDVAENRKRLVVLEASGARQLRYLGEAHCAESWMALAPDVNGAERSVWKFRLVFDQPAPGMVQAAEPQSRNPLRRPRAFEAAAPRPLSKGTRAAHTTPEETAALLEKANREHRRLLVSLQSHLVAHGWTSIEEIPAAVDLWATMPSREGRVIFEVKTLSGGNEPHQCRGALSQLVEYKFFYGADQDRLCIVLSGPIADRRRALFEHLGVAVVMIDQDGIFVPVGQLAYDWFALNTPR